MGGFQKGEPIRRRPARAAPCGRENMSQENCKKSTDDIRRKGGGLIPTPSHSYIKAYRSLFIAFPDASRHNVLFALSMAIFDFCEALRKTRFEWR
jgi:hypothetical protein